MARKKFKTKLGFMFFYKTMVGLVVVAAVAGSGILLINKNSYQADTLSNNKILTTKDMLRIKNSSTVLLADLQSQKQVVEKTIAEYQAKDPSHNLDAQMTGKFLSPTINPEKITVDRLAYQEAFTKKTTLDRQIAEADNIIKSVNENGNLIKPTATLYDLQKNLLLGQKEVDRLATGGAKIGFEKLMTSLTPPALVKTPPAELTAISKKITMINGDIKAQQKKLDNGTTTKEEVKVLIDKDIQSLITSLNNTTNSKIKALPNKAEVLAIFGPLATGLNATSVQLFKPPALPLELTNGEQTVDALLSRVMENLPSTQVYNVTQTPTKVAAATRDMSLQQKAKLATDSARALLIDADNNGTLETINPDLSYADKLTAVKNVNGYLGDIKGLPALTGLSQERVDTFLLNNSMNIAEIIVAKDWMNERISKGEVATSAQWKDYLGVMGDINYYKSEVVNNYSAALSQQANKTDAFLPLQNVVGMDKPTWDLFNTFASTNKLTVIGATNMVSAFGNDQNRIVNYMNSGDTKLYGQADKLPKIMDWNFEAPSLTSDFKSFLTKTELEKTNTAGQIMLDTDAGWISPDAKQPAVTLNVPTRYNMVMLPNGTTVDGSDFEAVKQGVRDYLISMPVAYGSDEVAKNLALAKMQGYCNSDDLIKVARAVDALVNNSIVAKQQTDTTLTTPAEQPLTKKVLTTDYYRNGIFINPATGQAEYASMIKRRLPDGRIQAIGHISFNPMTGTVDAQVPYSWKDRQVTLFSDPRTGDVYIELAKRPFGSTEVPLTKFGNTISIMTVTVSSTGHIGGQFKLGNRLFNYNPNSKSFEMQVNIGAGRQLWFDTKGNIRGYISLTKEGINNGSLYFDRTGNIGLSYELKTGKINAEGERATLASININKNGEIGGSADLGKIITGKNGASFFVGFDKSGVTGVSIPMGQIAGRAFGLGVSRDGSLSFGGFIPNPLYAGLPIPISAGQDAHGNAMLSWPGGKVRLFGKEDRPLDAPAPLFDEATSSYDASMIYYRHSFKKGWKVVRVYQLPGEKIEKDEQVARGDMIFDTYNELLKRNPSISEFLNWYFYSGHELYAFPEHNKKEYRMRTLKEIMERTIKSGPTGVVPEQYRYGNEKEYRWLKDGKDPLNAPTRPVDVLEENPFKAELIDQAQEEVPVDGIVDSTDPDGTPTAPAEEIVTPTNPDGTPETETTALNPQLDEFSRAIEAAALEDPLFSPDKYLNNSL